MWIALFLIFLFALPVRAEGEMERQMEQVLSGVDFAALEDMRIQLPGMDSPQSVEGTVRLLVSGEGFSPEALLSAALGGFTKRLSELGTLMMSIMLPVLLVSLLSYTSGGNGRAEVLGRNVCFVIVLIPIVLCVIGELEHVKSSITLTTERMDRILPLLLTLLTAVGGSASSAFLHPVVVAASGSMVYLAREVILRLVMCTCAVTTVNHLSDRAHLTRMAKLLRSIVCWLLGVSFTVFLGAMSIQGVCSASIDGVAIRAAKYAVDNFVPIVGGMFSDTMDTLVGCTLIVKNALGVTAMLVLGGVIIEPMIRTLAATAVLKLCAALLEPVAPAQTVSAIEDFSGTIVLFLITMLCVGTMYFLLIVQMLLVGNLTVMLR